MEVEVETVRVDWCCDDDAAAGADRFESMWMDCSSDCCREYLDRDSSEARAFDMVLVERAVADESEGGVEFELEVKEVMAVHAWE